MKRRLLLPSLCLLLLCLAARPLHAAEPERYVSEDGEWMFSLAADNQIDLIIPESEGKTINGTYTVNDTRRVRAITHIGDFDRVFYFQGTDTGWVTDTGVVLTRQLDVPTAVDAAETALNTLREESFQKVKRIGEALKKYGSEKDGVFPGPDGAAMLQILVTEQLLPADELFVNPLDQGRQAPGKTSVTEATTSYAYIGAGFPMGMTDKSYAPVLIQKPTSDKWVSIFFVDGRTQAFHMPEAKTLEEVVKSLNNYQGLKNDFLKERLLTKARAADVAEAAAKPNRH